MAPIPSGKRSDTSRDCLFTSRKRKAALLVPSVNGLIKKWTKSINLRGNYGAHTLRKTFGYIQRLSLHFSKKESRPPRSIRQWLDKKMDKIDQSPWKLWRPYPPENVRIHPEAVSSLLEKGKPPSSFHPSMA